MNIDQEPNEETQDLVLRKTGLVLNVLDRYRTDICDQPTFTAQESVHLGGDYLAYSVDFLLLFQDLALAHLGSNRYAPEFASGLHTERVEKIAILEQIKHGNFRTLKGYLRREAERFSGTDRLGLLELAAYSEEDRRKFVEKLRQMTEVIPDEDDQLSWSPPQLAWPALERYNTAGENLWQR